MSETPRLSPSIAKVLLTSPLKARMQHRLLGNVRTEPTAAQETGSLFESFIIGNHEEKVALIPFKDFRTNAAKEEKVAAKAQGLLPVIGHEYEGLVKAGMAIRASIESKLPVFADALDQVRYEWESGVLCSGVMDKLHIDHRIFIGDLKAISEITRDNMQRATVKYAYDIQAAAYIDAVETKHQAKAGRIDYRLIFYEPFPPYCVCIAELDGTLRQLGRSKWDKAKDIWRECMESDVWPEGRFKEHELNAEGHVRLSATNWQIQEMEDTDINSIFPTEDAK